MFGGQHRDDEVTRTELVGLDRGKNSRIVAHRPSEKTTGLHNCRGVYETNKTELNTLDEADFVRDDEADFVRDVDKSASHHLSQNEIGSDNPCSRQLSGNAQIPIRTLTRNITGIVRSW